jgi:pimeloyl-ACP methyl ester carboxylesterase
MKKFRFLRSFRFLPAFLFLLLLCGPSAGCGKDKPGSSIDYSQSSHWLSLPAPVKPVDVFYVYPTVWYKLDPAESNICAIDNRIMLAGSLAAYARQATAFETAGNVYAPYYRQADAIYTLSMPEADRWNIIKGTPAQDVTDAFKYYIEHFNNGRPFILAGHSQGSNVILVLLSEYMRDNPEIYKRMVAAYVTGYPVTARFLSDNPHLKFAEGPNDTGIIISYNTQSPAVLPGHNLVVANNIGLVINPISWTREETLATVAEGLGSFMPDPITKEYKKIYQYADAKIDKVQGVLICSTADDNALTPKDSPMGPGVYHSYDISFYYYNLRANAENRANKFLGK